MKRIKAGAAIIFLIVAIYFLISYGIFWIMKPSLDQQLQLAEQKSAQQNLLQVQDQHNDSVVIQSMQQPTCKDGACSRHHAQPDFIVTNDDQDEPLAQIIADDEQSQFIVSADDVVKKDGAKVPAYSFLTMPISDDYQLDQDAQDTLDVLIGNDVDEFVKLILQSNNNIVSKDVCRSCAMYAFFNKIKHHKLLYADDIRMLQKLLTNLYRFIEKMNALSDVSILRQEQYDALQDLHRSQAIKNDMRLKKRQAATAAALKKLQNIPYNR